MRVRAALPMCAKLTAHAAVIAAALPAMPVHMGPPTAILPKCNRSICRPSRPDSASIWRANLVRGLLSALRIGGDLMSALIDANGVVARWPRKQQERQAVLDHLAGKFEAGRIYGEGEVNEILRRFHSFGDWALLRRELFENGRLSDSTQGCQGRTLLAARGCTIKPRGWRQSTRGLTNRFFVLRPLVSA